MKTGILALLMFTSISIFADNNKAYDSTSAIELASKFIAKLRTNTPFLYEDEVAFFGEKTLYSYVILQKLGYVNEKGQWIKAKPKYSYLCELIRLNSDFLLLKDPSGEYYFSGIQKIVSKDAKLYDSPFDANIAYVQEVKASPDGLVNSAKNIIIRYRIPQKKLDLPIFSDGKPLLEHMGFSLDPKGVPQLGEKELDALLKHMSSLDK